VLAIDWRADRSRWTAGFRTVRHIEIGALAYGATIEDLLDDIAERLSAWPREALSKVARLTSVIPIPFRSQLGPQAITSLLFVHSGWQSQCVMVIPDVQPLYHCASMSLCS